MDLREAKEQIEREHPELTGTAKIQAIKALREQHSPKADPSATKTDNPVGVGEAWAGFLLVFVGMRLLGWWIWGSLTAEPAWFDVLYVVMLVTAISSVARAYRVRGGRP